MPIPKGIKMKDVTWYDFCESIKVSAIGIAAIFVIAFIIVAADPQIDWDAALMHAANFTFYFGLIPASALIGYFYCGYRKHLRS